MEDTVNEGKQCAHFFTESTVFLVLHTRIYDFRTLLQRLCQLGGHVLELESISLRLARDVHRIPMTYCTKKVTHLASGHRRVSFYV